MNMKNDLAYTGTLGNLDIVLPEAVIPYEDYIYFGRGKYSSFYGILSFPSYMYVGYFDQIISEMRSDVYSMSWFAPVSQKAAIDMFNTQIGIMEANQSFTGDKDAALVRKILDYKETREGIQLNQEILMQCVRIYKVSGRSKKELSDNCDKFENLCENMSIIVKCLILDQEEAFKSCLPMGYMGYNEKKYVKNIDSGGFVSIVSKGKSGLLHKNGTYWGTMLETGAPVVYDKFIGPPYLTNPMVLVFGISGAGKSVALKCFGSRDNATRGDTQVFFDVEGETRALVESRGGKYYELEGGNNNKSGFNPCVPPIIEEDGVRYVAIEDAIEAVHNMLNLLSVLYRKKELNEDEIIGLQYAMEHLYVQHGVTEDPESLLEQRETDGDGENKIFNVKKVAKKLFRLTELKEVLYEDAASSTLAKLMELCTGDRAAAMFDCYAEERFDFHRKMTGIGYKKIKNKRVKTFAVGSMYEIISNLLADYNLKGIGKTINIDEMWHLLKEKFMIEQIEDTARRGRKYWISLVMATHFVADLLSSEEGRAILKISATKIIMKQNYDSVDDIADYFKLSDDIRRELALFDEGDAVVISGMDKFRMHVDVFDFEKDLVFI